MEITISLLYLIAYLTAMKKLLPALFICLSLLSNAQIIDIDQPKTYIPQGLSDLQIGMGINDFHKILDTTTMDRISNFGYAYIQFTKNNPAANINTIAVKFDTPQRGINNNRPAYEFMFEFDSPENAADYVKEKFTGPYRLNENGDKEWFLSTTKDYWILVRQSSSKITIAAMMSGTEWGFE